jgi:hypothetical protein
MADASAEPTAPVSQKSDFWEPKDLAGDAEDPEEDEADGSPKTGKPPAAGAPTTPGLALANPSAGMGQSHLANPALVEFGANLERCRAYLAGTLSR